MNSRREGRDCYQGLKEKSCEKLEEKAQKKVVRVLQRELGVRSESCQAQG